MRRLLLAALLSVSAVGLALPSGASPLEPPRDRWYAANEAQAGKGHWSSGDRVRVDQACLSLPAAQQGECSLQALRDKEHVVVAFVDSGINPYHQDFRAPELTVHPSRYVEGYPGAAEAFDLALPTADTQGYAAARAADDEEWQDVGARELRWFPGTRVIGGVSVGTGGTGLGTAYPERRILDDNGHGTGVASVGAGRWFGSSPDALVVMVEGLGNASVRWATEQPWIDVISNSWGPGLPGRVDVPTSMAFTKAAVQKGQSVLFSSGNGAYNTNSSTVFRDPATDPCRCKVPPPNVSTTASGSGPSWHITVGAASPVNGQAHWWHGRVPDVASFGSKWRAAAADGVLLDDDRDFGGTSCATPITAGVLATVVQQARALLGDTTEGPATGGVVAQAPPGAALPAAGPLADGALTRAEAEALVLRSARPVPADPHTLSWDYAVEPTTDSYFVAQGYGVVDRGARDRALAALRGEAPLPVRPDVEQWRAVTDAARDLEWS